jgi:hypothetical protein
MSPLFKKLNFKDQQEIVIINAPESFEGELNEMQKVCAVESQFIAEKKVSFLMIFVKQQVEIDQYSKIVVDHALGDAIIWFVYPKKSSKKYKCDFDRDHGWQSLGNLGLEPVKMVALDVDWSALRFRNVTFIRTLNRSFAMSLEGKLKTNKNQ